VGELLSIFEPCAAPSPGTTCIDPTLATMAMNKGEYWSASTSQYFATDAWMVGYGDVEADAQPFAKTQLRPVRAVRGAPPS
jgi:hypothetical protein